MLASSSGRPSNSKLCNGELKGLIMELNKPEQVMKRDLQGVASDLKWSAVELKQMAERLSLAGNEPDAQAALRMCAILIVGEDKLNGYVDEVTAGWAVRAKPV